MKSEYFERLCYTDPSASSQDDKPRQWCIMLIHKNYNKKAQV